MNSGANRKVPYRLSFGMLEMGSPGLERMETDPKKQMSVLNCSGENLSICFRCLAERYNALMSRGVSRRGDADCIFSSERSRSSESIA